MRILNLVVLALTTAASTLLCASSNNNNHMLWTAAEAKALAVSDFNEDMPSQFPHGYTLATSSGAAATPADGVVNGIAGPGRFGFSSGFWRDEEKLTMGIIDNTFKIVRYFDPTSKQVKTIAGIAGQTGGPSTGSPLTVNFEAPSAIVSFNGKYIIADRLNHCLLSMSPTSVSTPSNPIPNFSDVEVFAGTCNVVPAGIFSQPTSLAVTQSYLYIADLQHDDIKKIPAIGVQTVTSALSVAALIAEAGNLKPVHVRVFNDEKGYVVSSNGAIRSLDLVAGTVGAADVAAGYSVDSQIAPTVDAASMTFFFVATHPTIDGAKIFVGLDGKSDIITPYYTYASGITDGHNPTFQDVTSIFAMSNYELLVLQKDAVRGIYVREPLYTDTKTMSLSISEYDFINIPVYFLASIMPMTNATAMEILRQLFILDLNECLMGVSRCVNATSFDYDDAHPVVVVTNASVPASFPQEQGQEIIRTCHYKRMKAFLGAGVGGRICAVNENDVTNGAVTDTYCTGEPLDTQRYCDTRCKIAAIISSIGFAICVAIVVILALTVGGNSVIVSIFLLMPEGI